MRSKRRSLVLVVVVDHVAGTKKQEVVVMRRSPRHKGHDDSNFAIVHMDNNQQVIGGAVVSDGKAEKDVK